MFEQLRLKIAIRLLAHGQFIISTVTPKGDKKNYLCQTYMSMNHETLAESFDQVMIKHKEIRKFVLDRAANYLQRHEIDCMQFTQTINK